jgi:hypothetical protein
LVIYRFGDPRNISHYLIISTNLAVFITKGKIFQHDPKHGLTRIL